MGEINPCSNAGGDSLWVKLTLAVMQVGTLYE